VDELMQDLRYTMRQWVRRPGVAAVLLLTLALGVGANTAVFSVVQGVLLRPLPFPEPDRLAVVWSQFPTMKLDEFPASWPEYTDFRDQNRAFEQVGAWRGTQRTITGGDAPERLSVTLFTASMWDVLGVAPRLGRVFTADEDIAGNDDVVVLSHGLWVRRFGGDPSVLGKTIELDGRDALVLGVMPETFNFEIETEGEAWIPMGIDPGDPPGRGNHFALIGGRLAPGVTFERAEEDLADLMAKWSQDGSLGHAWGPPGHPAFIRPLHEQVVGDVEASLMVLLGAVGIVLLIACANVANLLLIRGEGRRREISIRASMGANRRRLVRQLVTESVGMAIAGGVLGVLLALAGLRALLAIAPASLPRVGEIGLDGTVLLFSGAVALAAGFLFGVAPALQAARLDVQGALREEGRGGTAGRGRFRLRQLLVVSEMAMAVMLLIAAGLLMQSFWRLQRVDPGFRAERVLALSISPPSSTYPEPSDVTGLYRDLLPQVAALPGVTSAGAVRTAPLTGSLNPNDIEIENTVPSSDGPPFNADVQVITPGYIETLGIPVLRGRAFEPRDDADAEVVAVIDELLAGRFFPGENPIGRRIRQNGAEWSTIVGVVGRVHQEGLDIEPRATLYLAHAQTPLTWFPVRGMTLLLRTGVEPLGLVSAVRGVVRGMDSDLPVYEVTTMAGTIADSTATERFSMFLQLVFAGVALVLAVVGVYGVLSYSVAQRTREIGIRMALGAEQSGILKLVVGQGMALVAAAIAVGVLGAFATGQLLSSLLFGVSPRDPVTYGVVAGVLATVAAVACYLPARRASEVSPQTALRCD
jgi:putative ABC transport system permease protein